MNRERSKFPIGNQMQFRHGHATNGIRTPTYRSWQAMLARCFNPNDGHFSGYGARGITACDRWNDFANFLADMGERPAADAVEVERLQRLMQKIMARCADLLDEDQFNELDAVARATDPTDVARQIAEGPCCDECGKSKRDGWALYCVACLERVLTPDPTDRC